MSALCLKFIIIMGWTTDGTEPKLGQDNKSIKGNESPLTDITLENNKKMSCSARNRSKYSIKIG